MFARAFRLNCSALATVAACLQAFAAAAATAPAMVPSAGVANPSLHALGAQPMRFEPLATEAGAPARFQARGARYRLLVAPTEATLGFEPLSANASVSRLVSAGVSAGRSLRIELLNANRDARIRGQDRLPGVMNYFIGSDPSKWRGNVGLYSRVTVEQVYQGVDLTYYGNDRQLEYDFTVAAGADPEMIRIRIQGADKVTINEQGELVMSVGAEVVTQPRPVLYELGSVRREIKGGYIQKDSQTVGFWIGPRDPSRTLVIDPVLSYASLFGGNAGDMGLAVKLDAQGSIYIAGQTLSDGFSIDTGTNGFQSRFQGGSRNGDAFVAKFDNFGSNLVYFTYLGGSRDDGAFDLAVDSEGRAILTGFTDSPDFPVAPAGGVPGLAPRIGGKLDPFLNVYPTDAFVAELSPDGSSLVFSSYLGGSGADVGGGVAVDPAGNIYVTGNTFSTNFPTLNPIAYQLAGSTNTLLNRLAGSNDVFVTKILAQGAGLVYSTYLGGAKSDEGGGIAADADGFAYVTGYTASTNFPVTVDALQTNLNHSPAPAVEFRKKPPAFDAFFARIAPSGSELVYSTLFGGTNNDTGFRIALDSARNVFITGSTYSPDFPLTNATAMPVGVTNTYPNSDAFLTRFTSSGALVASTVFGSESHDVGWDIALNPLNGNPYVIGITGSTNYPIYNAGGFSRPQNIRLGITDFFVTAFDHDSGAVLYSLLIGGSNDDYGYGVAVDPAGNAYVVGRTTSTNFPSVGNTPILRGANDAFVAKISLEPTLTTVADGEKVTLEWPGFAPEYFVEARSGSDSSAQWAPISQPALFSNGWHTTTIPATNASSLFRLRKQ